MSADHTQPLLGTTVVITRAREQQSEGRRLLQSLGARVLDLPALEIGPPDSWAPLDDALADLENFHWLIVSSANGVDAVESRLQLKGQGLMQRPESLKIAAVGRKTAQRLEELGAPADFVPPTFVADSLIDHFPVSGWGLRILLPRVQSGGRTLLAEAFGEAGSRVVEVAAYESRCPTSIPADTLKALGNGEVDVISFSSGKTVTHTVQLLADALGHSDIGQLFKKPAVVSIGPQTSQRCKELLGRVDKEATPHDMEGLVQACIQAMQSR
ncbi:uroporphyrinogen-III synthase [Synechococcus sp. GEYO]|uniref:uroporphyrinogen-III synthase n=1 Tax=Synechococcus sp. GEYO TaxID=2575511 RepID=UPI000E0FC65F|nr:uroporphyrinogen-III synthase [Synechococcus sp. GEYO]